MEEEDVEGMGKYAKGFSKLDKEMIEDLIVSAVNQALQNAGKVTEEKMNSITGGLAGKIKLPGMV